VEEARSGLNVIVFDFRIIVWVHLESAIYFDCGVIVKIFSFILLETKFTIAPGASHLLKEKSLPFWPLIMIAEVALRCASLKGNSSILLHREPKWPHVSNLSN